MMKFNKGQKIWFAEEKRPYTIRACNERYLICTKPFNLQPKTVMYTIVDLEEEIRATDGYRIGPYVYYSQEDYDAYLKELEERVKREKENDSIIIQDLSSTHDLLFKTERIRIEHRRNLREILSI